MFIRSHLRGFALALTGSEPAFYTAARPSASACKIKSLRHACRLPERPRRDDRLAPHRWWHALAVLALAAAVIGPSLGAAPRLQAQSSPHLFVPAQFDSIAIDNPSFSPNGDRVRDVVSITYKLADSSQVALFVTRQGATDTLRQILAPTWRSHRRCSSSRSCP